MMNLSPEQLKQVEELAYRLVPPELIAVNLEIDAFDFKIELNHTGSPVHKAFFCGYLKQLIETREALIKSAHNGSNPAQIELLKFIRDIDTKLKYG